MLYLGSAAARTNGHPFHRDIDLEFSDPRASFQANTTTWSAINGWLAMGVERLAGTNMMSKAAARTALFAGGLYVNSMLRYYSHEAAHEFEYRHHNIEITNAIDMQHWKSSYLPGVYYPSWRQGSLNPSRLDDEELMSSFIAGLNQDEMNAAAVWRSNSQSAAVSFYDAQSFLLTGLRDIDYIARSKSSETPFAPGMSIKQLQHRIYQSHPQLYDDVNLYRLMLLNNGIQVDNRQLLTRSIFASAFSWRTWESLYALFAYIAGCRKIAPTSLHLNANASLSMPLFSHYLLLDGGFMNSQFMLSTGGRQIEFQLGSTLAWGRTIRARRWRVGARVYDIFLFQNISIEPFAFLNAGQNTHIDGASIGLENFIFLTQRTALRIKLQFSRNDIFENKVKRLEPGAHFSFGLRARL